MIQLELKVKLKKVKGNQGGNWVNWNLAEKLELKIQKFIQHSSYECCILRSGKIDAGLSFHFLLPGNDNFKYCSTMLIVAGTEFLLE